MMSLSQSMQADGDGARIRVMSVDDHALLREGIAAVIERQPDMELVGEAANGRDPDVRTAGDSG